MKKQYMSPKIEEVRLQVHGGLLFGSLTDGEVGAPDMPFDNGPELPSMPELPGVPTIPGMPSVPGFGPSIP